MERCYGCDEMIGATPVGEGIAGCALCDADLSIYGVVDAPGTGPVCLGCALGLRRDLEVFVSSQLALNLARLSANEISFTTARTMGISCGSCGRLTPPSLPRFPGAEGRCFLCSVYGVLGEEFTAIPVEILRAMYGAVAGGCLHGPEMRRTVS